jgi:hypothetical protein
LLPNWRIEGVTLWPQRVRILPQEGGICAGWRERDRLRAGRLRARHIVETHKQFGLGCVAGLIVRKEFGQKVRFADGCLQPAVLSLPSSARRPWPGIIVVPAIQHAQRLSPACRQSPNP